MSETIKKPYHHSNLYQALLEAGVRLLEEKGVNGFSLREVAKRAGVSHAAPYRHFKNKSELLKALALYGFRKLTEGIQAVVEAAPEDPETQLVESAQAYVELVMVHPAIADLMFGDRSADMEFCDPEQAIAMNSFSGLANIIARGQQAGVFIEGETLELAITAWAQVHGFALLFRSSQKRERFGLETEPALKLQLRKSCEMLLTGIKRTE